MRSALTKSQRKHAARSRRRAKKAMAEGRNLPKTVDTSSDAKIPELKLEPTAESLKLTQKQPVVERKQGPKKRIPASNSERRLALSLALHPRVGKNSWIQKLHVPKPLLREILGFGASEPVVFMVGGCKVGRADNRIDAEDSRSEVRFLSLPGETDEWQDACPMTIKRGKVAGAAVWSQAGEHLILAAGGQVSTHENPKSDTVPLSSCELYSSSRNHWVPCKAEMKHKRTGAVAVGINGKAYIFGGDSKGAYPFAWVRDIEMFELQKDGTGKFTVVGRMPDTRNLWGMTATAFGPEEVLVTSRLERTGNYCPDCNADFDCICYGLQIDVFNVTTLTWRSLPFMPHAVDSPAVGTLLDEKKQPALIVVAGGTLIDGHFWGDGCPTSNRTVDTVKVLNLKSRSGKPEWHDAPSLFDSHSCPAFLTLGKYLYVLGGVSGCLFPGMNHLRTGTRIDMTQLLCPEDGMSLEDFRDNYQHELEESRKKKEPKTPKPKKEEKKLGLELKPKQESKDGEAPKEEEQQESEHESEEEDDPEVINRQQARKKAWQKRAITKLPEIDFNLAWPAIVLL